MDVNHHDSYTMSYGTLRDGARRLAGLSVLFVGVRCPVDVIWDRRAATWGQRRETAPADVVAAVELAQVASHAHGIYDLEIDTSVVGPSEGAELIRVRLERGPGTAFPTHAAGADGT